MLPDDNPLLIGKRIIQDESLLPQLVSEFANDNEVVFYFGVDSLNKDNVDHWDPSDLGKVKFSDTFDISSRESQDSLRLFC